MRGNILMKILIYPHPALIKKAQPIKQFDKRLSRFAREMFETMYRANGVGLAGTQVNFPYAIAVINITRKPTDEIILLNPKIVRTAGTIICNEGCLSVPDVSVKIKRATKVVCEAHDLTGNKFTFTAEDLLARAVQHEVDHLNGVLIVNRAEKP